MLQIYNEITNLCTKKGNLLVQKNLKRHECDDLSLNIIKAFYSSDVSFIEKN